MKLEPFVKAFNPTSILMLLGMLGYMKNNLRLVQPSQHQSLMQPVTTYKPQQAFHNKGTASFQSNANKPSLLPLPPNTTRTNYRPYPYIPANVKAEKIVKGLCYFCDQKYDKNH